MWDNHRKASQTIRFLIIAEEMWSEKTQPNSEDSEQKYMKAKGFGCTSYLCLEDSLIN